MKSKLEILKIYKQIHKCFYRVTVVFKSPSTDDFIHWNVIVIGPDITLYPTYATAPSKDDLIVSFKILPDNDGGGIL